MPIEPFEFPTVPDRADRLTFPARMAAFFAKLATFPAWAQTVAEQCYENATTMLSLAQIRSDIEDYLSDWFDSKASLSGAHFTGPVTVPGAAFTGPVTVPDATASGNPVALGQFGGSIGSTSHYIKIPQDVAGVRKTFILMFGIVSGGTGEVLVNYPMTFPATVLTGSATPIGDVSSATTLTSYFKAYPGLSNCVIERQVALTGALTGGGDQASSHSVFWWLLGY